jgi:hypothetical protein
MSGNKLFNLADLQGNIKVMESFQKEMDKKIFGISDPAEDDQLKWIDNIVASIRTLTLNNLRIIQSCNVDEIHTMGYQMNGHIPSLSGREDKFFYLTDAGKIFLTQFITCQMSNVFYFSFPTYISASEQEPVNDLVACLNKTKTIPNTSYKSMSPTKIGDKYMFPLLPEQIFNDLFVGCIFDYNSRISLLLGGSDERSV